MLAFALLAVSGASLAATQDWWTTAPPATDERVVEIDLSYRDMQGRPHRLADPSLARTVASAPGITLNAAPTEKGGYCLLPHLTRKPGDSAVAASLGLSCGFAPEEEGDRATSTFGTLAITTEDTDSFYAYGRMTHPEAAALDLTEAAGEPLRMTLGQSGFFLAALPATTWRHLDDRRAEIAVLDAHDRALENVCVRFGSSSRGSVSAHVLGRVRPGPCEAG